MRPQPQPLDCDGYDMTNDHNGNAPSFGHTYKLDNGSASAEPELHTIGQLMLAQGGVPVAKSQCGLLLPWTALQCLLQL
jgi:hypothetical protein